MKEKVVFLDKDGVIIKNDLYPEVPKLRFMDNFEEGIKLLNETGFIILMVTNQSWIARGELTVEELKDHYNGINEHLKKFNAHLDDLFYCPHDRTANCNCRKPATGMIEQAKEKYDIDINNSYFIGDLNTDIEIARKIGCKSILVENPIFSEENKEIPDFKAKNVNEAARWIIENEQKE